VATPLTIIPYTSFSGLTREKNGATTFLASEQSNWVYRYEPAPGQWTRMLSETDTDLTSRSVEGESAEPVPRYAHQVVYDPNTRMVYMHGGNAGLMGALERQNGSDGEEPRSDQEGQRAEGEEKEKRLDDFWKMTLTR